MSTISWEEYLKTLLTTFRNHYDKLSDKEKSETQLNTTFAKPCQIEFFSFEGDGQAMIVTFYKDRPDDLRVYERVKEDPSSLLKEKVLNFKDASYFFDKRTQERLKGGRIQTGYSWTSLGDDASIYLFEDLIKVRPDPESYANMIFEDVRKNALERLRSRNRITKYETIKEEVEAIKQDIKRIDDSYLRSRLLESAKKIDETISAVKTLEKHEQRLSQIEQEIGGVRKMIGTTKEYQDFRVLATDVDDLKKSHVHKDVFESEIKRLDQRIDSLREIRFWSKRTIVDIVLAVIATVSTTIATLLATGIIKF
jgi:hypothetical protein